MTAWSIARHRPAHLPQLDGLRCLAVGLVIWSHAGPYFAFGQHGVGPYGVWLFFVLSAYLITGILLRLRGAPIGAALRAFYARRFLRIFPAYYGLIALLLVLGFPIPMRELWGYLLYLTNWTFIVHGWPPAMGHVWTLAVEEQFYLVWPWVVLRTRAERLPRVFVGVIVLAIAYRALLIVATGRIDLAESPTPGSLDALGLGALLAWHTHTHPLAVEQRRRWLSRGVALGLVLLALTAALSLWRPSPHVFAVTEAVGAALLSAWLIDRAAAGRIPWLAWRPLRYLGTISYGIYLLQTPLRWLLGITLGQEGHAAGNVTLFLLVFALSAALAALSWRYYEGPINRLKRHFPYPIAPDAAPIRNGDHAGDRDSRPARRPLSYGVKR